MKYQILTLLSAASLTACFSAPDPAELENTIEVQDKKMYEKFEKSRLRKQQWDQRWKDYSRRQDAKYDAWIDGMFD